MSQVAEKRKTLLDEMSTCMTQKTDELKKELEKNLKEYSQTISELTDKLTEAEVSLFLLPHVAQLTRLK